MRSRGILFLVLFLLCLSPAVRADSFVLDLSGTDGHNGRSGGDGWGNSASGSPGQHGTHGTSGRDIRLWVRPVEGAPGRAHLDVDGEADREVDLNAVEAVVLRSNGGRGGHGGNGGDGAHGRDGRNGTDCGPFTFAGNGENGGDGGNGGEGGNGGDAGDAGDIEVNVSETDLPLVAKLRLEAKGGLGGSAGRHGHGGRGGRGGRGGSRSYYDPFDQEWKWCFLGGNDGSHGRGGYSPSSRLSGGRNGRDGRISIRVHREDGSSFDYPGVFRLEVESAELQEQLQDGVLEPGEKITLKSVTLRNRGQMPAPEAGLRLLDLGADLQLAPGSPAAVVGGGLRPAESKRYEVASQGVTLLAGAYPVEGVLADLSGVRLRLPRTPRYSASLPATLTQTVSAVAFTAPEERKAFPLRVNNLSRVDLGRFGRSLKIRFRLDPSDGNSRYLRLTWGGTPLTLGEDVPLDVAAGKQLDLELAGEVEAGAPFGFSATLAAELFVGNVGADGWTQAGVAATRLTFQAPTGANAFDYHARLHSENVYVSYPNGSRYKLARLWVRKKADEETIRVEYELAKFWPNNSPKYYFSQNELSPVLATLVGRGPLSRDQLVTLMKIIQGKATGDWVITKVE